MGLGITSRKRGRQSTQRTTGRETVRESNLRFHSSSEGLWARLLCLPDDQTRFQQCTMLMEWRSNCTEVCTVCVAQFATYIPCRVIVGGSVWVRGGLQHRPIQHTLKTSLGWVEAGALHYCLCVRCQSGNPMLTPFVLTTFQF